jgi:hypothetical protein
MNEKLVNMAINNETMSLTEDIKGLVLMPHLYLKA